MNTEHELSEPALLAAIFDLTLADPTGNQTQVNALLDVALSRSVTHSKLFKRAKQCIKQANYARQQCDELQEKINNYESKQQIDAWLAHVCEGRAVMIKQALLTHLEKYAPVKAEHHQRRFLNKSTVKPIELHNGIHPNSLSLIPTVNRYQVYIDETGMRFSPNAQEGGAVGRYVAVVVPTSVNLPALYDYHSSEVDSIEVDKVMETLLQHPVGILGFTAQDTQIQTASGWLFGMMKLVRWIAYLLPMQPQQHVLLDLAIEQRSYYTHKRDLEVLSDLIEEELRGIDARFKYLTIKVRFEDKQHVLLGYADAIAYSWGTHNAASKDRLKKTQLIGHCLLNPDDHVIEKLYLMTNDQAKLLPSEWYQICGALTLHGTGVTWLHDFINKVIAKVQKEPHLWQGYLNYVRDKLVRKDYDLQELASALCFLQQSCPPTQQLPLQLRLQLTSAKLSLTSHQGHLDKPLFTQAIELIETIAPENAPLACESLLRLFSMTTNVFEYTRLASLIDSWLALHPWVVGRSNYAKLLSTQGQISAFQHAYSEAMDSFTLAIEQFQLLHDQQHAERDIVQTRCYLLMAALNDDNAKTICQTLVGQLLDSAGCMTIQTLAGNTDPRLQFSHHVILKALVKRPEWFKQSRQAYFDRRDDWQLLPSHPWQWIAFYRGVLCWQFDNQHTVTYLQSAVEHCPNGGIIFRWMSLVMHHAAAQLAAEIKPQKQNIDDLHTQIPNLPSHLLDQKLNADSSVILTWLEKALPFNFH